MKSQKVSEKNKTSVVDSSLEQSRKFNDLIVVENHIPADRIASAMQQIDMRDSNSITSYGVHAQRHVNSVSDNILKSVKSRDVGPVADSLSQIVLSIRGLDTTGLQKKQGFLARILRAASPVATFLSSYETTISQINSIVDHLDGHTASLSRSVAELDVLYRETEDSTLELEIFITAIKRKMTDYEQNVLPAMKERAESAEIPMAGQEYSDARAVYDRLDRKYINLCLTRQVALQNLPSIRLTQEHDVALLEKINDIQVNTVPLWKRQLAITLESAKTVGTGKAINAATDLTNQMLVEGAKQLGQAQVEARKTIERGVIDIKAVEQANEILIGTLTQVQGMVTDARNMRRDAEKRIEIAEKNLTKAITAS